MLAAALLALAAPEPAAAQADGAPKVVIDAALLVGTWTDDDDCSDTIRFARDGSFVAADGGTGRWRLDGDLLTLSGRETIAVRIVMRDSDSLDVLNADGSVGHSTRCPAPDDADAPVVNDIA